MKRDKHEPMHNSDMHGVSGTQDKDATKEHEQYQFPGFEDWDKAGEASNEVNDRATQDKIRSEFRENKSMDEYHEPRSSDPDREQSMDGWSSSFDDMLNSYRQNIVEPAKDQGPDMER